MADLGPGTGLGCPSTAPDDYRVTCQLDAGHPGKHRNNMMTWEEPQRLFVGKVEPDLAQESEAWVGGEVRLARERQ